jgi:hypothetical protein
LSEVDMGGVFFLCEDLKLNKVKATIDTLKTQNQSIELNCPKEKMIEKFFDRDDFWKRFGRSKYHCYFKFGKIEFSLNNCERCGVWDYIYDGRRQVYLDVWGTFNKEDETWTDSFHLFLEEPEEARRFVDVFCFLASSLGAYLGFLGHKLLLDEDYETTGTIYAERLIEEGTYCSLYMDKDLAQDIGIDELKEWSSIINEVNDSGYFVSIGNSPFIGGIKKDDPFYRERIVPAITKRLKTEFLSI